LNIIKVRISIHNVLHKSHNTVKQIASEFILSAEKCLY